MGCFQRDSPLQLGKPLTGYTNDLFNVAFSPDNASLASASLDGTIILWNVNPQSWAVLACQKAGRNFTITEWAKYFPSEDYHKTCAQWP